MRENRTSGSEGGGTDKELPTPIADVCPGVRERGDIDISRARDRHPRIHKLRSDYFVPIDFTRR